MVAKVSDTQQQQIISKPVAEKPITPAVSEPATVIKGNPQQVGDTLTFAKTDLSSGKVTPLEYAESLVGQPYGTISEKAEVFQKLSGSKPKIEVKNENGGKLTTSTYTNDKGEIVGMIVQREKGGTVDTCASDGTINWNTGFAHKKDADFKEKANQIKTIRFPGTIMTDFNNGGEHKGKIDENEIIYRNVPLDILKSMRNFKPQN